MLLATLFVKQVVCVTKRIGMKVHMNGSKADSIRKVLFRHKFISYYFPDGPRPSCEEVMEIRKQMLHYVKALILKGQGIHEDELQSILNYLTTVHEVRWGWLHKYMY